ncbi:MAG TPA: response regulator [Ktedonobacterales bacterium]|jgi:DNA-binding response OmpR family regulator|nr:response regulator [Ktedonobacterales bacterium]
MARVLVVEDDLAIRQMLTMALELEGYVVDALGDGAQVVPMLRAATERVVVLLDLMMPRVTGWEVCERLSAEAALAARHAVVVMSAALTPDMRLPEVVRAGLVKPFNLATALALVAALSVEPATTLASPSGEVAAHS